jgi:predicted aldo/keto reductase-like oxidoreductase
MYTLTDEDGTELITEAIEAGYRHIDTARLQSHLPALTAASSTGSLRTQFSAIPSAWAGTSSRQ